jgi:hypothetical protein
MSVNTRGDCFVVLVKSLGREGESYVVIPYLWSVSDDQKWEIKPLEAGYTIQRVSDMPIPITAVFAIEC